MALLACIIVVIYNQLQTSDNNIAHRNVIALAIVFSKLQWWAFIIPFLGLCGVRAKDITNRNVVLQLLPDLLAIFSVGWSVAALYIWHIQAPVQKLLPG